MLQASFLREVVDTSQGANLRLWRNPVVHYQRSNRVWDTFLGTATI